MVDAFQVEFPQAVIFQSKLKTLHMRFQAIANAPFKLKAVFSLCLHALQDVTPELIVLHTSAMEVADMCGHTDLYRRTSNLSESDRELLDKIKLHLLTNFNFDVTRKNIMNTIILIAHDLKDEQISYILNEYQ